MVTGRAGLGVIAAVAGVVGGLFGACSGEPVTGLQAAEHSCPTVAVSTDCAGGATYATIKPILERSCVPCHFSETDPDAPWPLTSYIDVAEWDDIVKANLLSCAQPPASSVYPFTAEDRATIVQWLACKHPEN